MDEIDDILVTSGMGSLTDSPLDKKIESTNNYTSQVSVTAGDRRRPRKEEKGVEKDMKRARKSVPLVKRGQDKPNKGLRHFSLKVCEQVREHGHTTYNEVADSLVRQAKRDGLEGFDEKNIRRRVYDALNVLMALQIISKDRKEIRWRGLPAAYHQDYDALIDEKEEIERRISKKRRQVEELKQQREAMRRLYKRNTERKYQEVDPNARIFLPFIVLNTHKDSRIECEMAPDRSNIFFNFNSPFEIHDDSELLRLLGLFEEEKGNEDTRETDEDNALS